MFRDLRGSLYVRVAKDAIPNQSMFAYKYFKDHLLSFAQRDVPLTILRKVLKDVEPEFKDLVGKITNIDPKRRITA